MPKSVHVYLNQCGETVTRNEKLIYIGELKPDGEMALSVDLLSIEQIERLFSHAENEGTKKPT